MLHEELHAGILTLRLEHGKANALDLELTRALTEAVDRLDRDDRVHGAVLSGTGHIFCAGVDLYRLLEGGAAYARDYVPCLAEAFHRLFACTKPVVAAVNGIAVGLGVQLALSCDLRVGAASARFAFTEGKLGLLPTHGGVARLVKLVGLARARDLLLGSATVDAGRALELGLLTEVVPDEELPAAAAALVERALVRAPQSYGLVKRLLAVAASADLASAMSAETIGQSLLVSTDDHREGREALRERRPPRFEGR